MWRGNSDKSAADRYDGTGLLRCDTTCWTRSSANLLCHGPCCSDIMLLHAALILTSLYRTCSEEYFRPRQDLLLPRNLRRFQLDAMLDSLG